MNDLVERLEDSIRAHRLLKKGQAILIAVSGGVDSVVLLALLHELSQRHHWKLHAAHLNHQLRGRSSLADERLVRNTARRLRVPLVVERANVRHFANTQKLSLEMAARQLRHEFLARVAVRSRIPTIALAHHADDQLELFFLRLLRGSGGEGLAGMKWRSASPANPKVELVRPLLGLGKTELRAYASAHKLPFREDETNSSLAIQRNRVRNELLPLLRQYYQPALDKTILRLMEIAGAEAEFACESARMWLSEVTKDRDKGEGLSKSFENLPLAVQRWVLQLQLRQLEVDSDFGLVEELRLKVAKPVSVPNPHVLGGDAVLRGTNGLLQLVKSGPVSFGTDSIQASLTKHGDLAFCGTMLSWRILNGADRAVTSSKGQEVFDADLVGTAITLRHWLPGDRFQPIGMASSVKLQDLFTNQKVPRERRHELVIATTASGELFWVQGLRISERFKLRKSTRRRLLWRWRRV